MAFPRRPVAKFSGGADVTTTSGLVVADNRDRIYLAITNNTDTDVSLDLATKGGVVPTAVANEGVVLKANGGSFATTAYSGPVYAVHGGAGTKRIAIVEI